MSQLLSNALFSTASPEEDLTPSPSMESSRDYKLYYYHTANTQPPSPLSSSLPPPPAPFVSATNRLGTTDMHSVSSTTNPETPMTEPMRFLAPQSTQLSSTPLLTSRHTHECRHFIAGRCFYGSQCRFAHTTSSLTRVFPSPNQPSMQPLKQQQQQTINAGTVLPSTRTPLQTEGLKMDSSSPLESLMNRQIIPKQPPPAYQSIRAQTPPSSVTAPAVQQDVPKDQQLPFTTSQSQLFLQLQRHHLLGKALRGHFTLDLKPGSAETLTLREDGKRGRQGTLQIGGFQQKAVFILINEDLNRSLNERNPYNNSLHGLLNHVSIFWSLVVHWRQSPSSVPPKWDFLLSKARDDSREVECMFYRTVQGCTNKTCFFLHYDPVEHFRLPSLWELINASDRGF